MDGISLLAGIGVGAVLGFVVANLLARGRSSAATATLQAQLEAARSDFARADGERITLQKKNSELLASEGAARSSASANEARVRELEVSAANERKRAEDAVREHGTVQTKLGRLETQLGERERALEELRLTVERSKQQLTETFKATGADVLKSTAESLLKQAKEQFEGHKQLSQQDLETRHKAVESLVAPLKEQLEKQEKLVQSLGEKREGDAKALAEQLKHIADLQIQASNAANTLSGAMRDNRQRGQWGEVSLRNVVEMAGMTAHVDFVEQTSIEGDEGARLRPDMVVRLPGERSVPIDAKVPMNAYFDSIDPKNSDSERSARRAAHASALRSHVKVLGSRDYAAAIGGTAELTVLFIPVESALISALEYDGNLFKEALDARIVITTPSTLLAFLRVCALQWKQAQFNENAMRIGESAQELLGRIQTLSEHLAKVGKGLDTASKAFNDAVGSYNSRLLPKARETSELAGGLHEAPQELEMQERVLRTDIVGLPPSSASTKP
jgi:DNA recombination protein RmuC